MKISNRKRWMSPPPLAKKNTKNESPKSPKDELATARADSDETTSTVGKIALMALAAGTILTGCKFSEPEPPPIETGTYLMEDPSVVVLDHSLERVDIDRGLKLECPAPNEPGFCNTEEVEYHPVGVLVGQGVVRDLNGNLFAVPQLQVNNDVTVAVKNPDHVKLEMPTLNLGTAELTQTSPGVFSYDTTIQSGDYTITLNGPQATVTNTDPAVTDLNFSVQKESDAKLVIRGGDVTNVEDLGDHLQVLDSAGGYPTRIVYGPDSYTVKGPQDISDWDITFTFEPGVMTRKEDNSVVHYEAYQSSNGWELGTGPDQAVEFSPSGTNGGAWSQQNMTVTWRGGELINSPR